MSWWSETSQGEFTRLVNEAMNVEMFATHDAYSLLRRVVGCQTEDLEADVSTDLDFEGAIADLHCEPAIRAVAPQAYLLLLDCFGNCSDSAMSDILKSVTKLVQLIAELMETHQKASRSAKRLLLPLPTTLLDEWWRETEKSSTFSLWLEGLWFCLSVVLAIKRNHSEATFSLYWTWLRCALSERFVESQSARAAESLSSLTAPAIVSLALTPYTSEVGESDSVSAPQAKKRKAVTIQKSLLDLDFSEIRNLFRDVWAIGGLLSGDLSIEALKKFVETSAKEWDDSHQDVIQHCFSLLFSTCATIDSALTETKRETVFCLPRSHWQFSFRDVAGLQVSATILCCNVVLRVLVPSAAMQTKYLGMSSQVKDTTARQQFASTVLHCLIQSVPSLLIGTQVNSLVQVSERQGSDNQETDSDGSDPDEDPQSTKKKYTSKLKAAEEKRMRARQALENLTSSTGDPLLAFMSMVLFMAPERREGRDRVIALVSGCVEEALRFEFGLSFLTRLVALLMTLSHHQKSSIRLLSIELASALQEHTLKNVIEGQLSTTQLHLFHLVLLMRISDEQSTVRSRALDLMANLMHAINRSPPSPAVDWYLAQLIAAESTPPSPAFDWVTFVSLCDSRIEDEKSLVRKSLLAVIESCSICLERPELSSVSLGDLFDLELLRILCDDIAITVRQKAVAVSATLLERSGTDLETREVCLGNLLRLSLDSEETISAKALEHARVLFFSKLPSTLKRFFAQLRADENANPQAPFSARPSSRDGSILSILNNGDAELSLMVILMRASESSESLETLARCLTKIHRTNSHCVDTIVDAILENAETLHPLNVPSAVIHLLQLCLEITPKRMKINLRMPLEHFDAIMRDHLLAKPIDISSVATLLEMLAVILPGRLDTKNCLHIKEHIMRCLMDFSIHPCLVKETLKLLFLLVGVDQQLLVDLVTASRKTLAQIHGKDDDREIPSTSEISCCLLTLGSSYVIASLLPPNNKTSKFLTSIARPLAIAALSIASDAFRETPVSVSVTESEEKTTTWLKQVPPWLRAVAVVSAGQILMSNESVAKKMCSRLLATAVKSETGNLNSDLTSNVSFAVFEFSLRMTSLVDPYFTLMTSALAHPAIPHTSGFVRHQVLALVAQLIAQDFLKAKGLLMYHLLSALGDPSRSVRRLARAVVQRVVSPRVRDLVLLYFVEMICFTCGFLKHPEIPLALDAHPLQMAICNTNVVAVEAFQLAQSDRARLLIYSALLSVASEQSKNLLTIRLIGDFLEPFVAHGQKTINKRSQQLEVPKSTSTPAGLALMDALTIISSSDLRLTFAPSNAEAVEDDMELEHAKKAHYERGVMKRFLAEHVLPRLMALRKAMQESNSTLQRDVLNCMARITFECSDDLGDLVPDPFLCQEIKARHQDVCQSSRIPLIADTEITTTDDDA